MKNIDKLFENEIKKNSLPYNERYWQDMELLLDKDKKRKKFVYFRLVALTLTVSAVALSAVYFATFNKQKHTAIETVNTFKNSGTETLPTNSQNKGNQSTSDWINEPVSTVKTEIKNLKHTINPTEKFDTKPTLNYPSLKTKLNSSIIEETTQSTLNISETNSIDQSTLMLISNDESETGYTAALRMNGISRFASMLNAQEFDKIDFTKIPYDRLRKSFKKNPFSSSPEHFLAVYSNFNPVVKTNISESADTKSGEEKYLSTMGYGLQYRLKKNRFVFSTGLGYNSTRIKSNYTTENRNVFYDTTYRIINPNYDQTNNGTRIALIKSFIDSNVNTYLSTPYPNQKTVFSYLVLPFSTQYCMQYKKLSWYVEAGIEAKFLLAASGQFWFLENGKQKIESAQNNTAVKSTIMNAGIGIGIRLPIVKDIQLFSGVHYYSPLNSMVSGYSQKLGTARINLGFEFRLK
ncbi:MAG TPA: hypothetical protein VGF79_10180 [Bacteroidia bacterium]